MKRHLLLVQEVLDFYGECDFDYGISVDHVILSYQPKFDYIKPSENADLAKNVFRKEITIALAEEFLKEHKNQGYRFLPVGVAHGWSPKTYAESVEQLQKIGYRYIAIGGLVPLKTSNIIECLEKN